MNNKSIKSHKSSKLIEHTSSLDIIPSPKPFDINNININEQDEKDNHLNPPSKKLQNIFVEFKKWNLIGPFLIINTGYNWFDLKLDCFTNRDEIIKIKYVGNITNNWRSISRPQGNLQFIYCYQNNNGIHLCNDIAKISFYGQTFNETNSCQKIFMIIKPKYYRDDRDDWD